MFEEEFNEEGIISSINKGVAEIILEGKGHCDECSAKIICRTDASGKRILLLENHFNGKEGDKIRISVNGKSILKATFLLYGFPVFLIVFGVIIGMRFFNNELYASILGFSLTALFFLLLFSFKSNRNSRDLIHTEILSLNKTAT